MVNGEEEGEVVVEGEEGQYLTLEHKDHKKSTKLLKITAYVGIFMSKVNYFPSSPYLKKKEKCKNIFNLFHFITVTKFKIKLSQLKLSVLFHFIFLWSTSTK